MHSPSMHSPSSSSLQDPAYSTASGLEKNKKNIYLWTLELPSSVELIIFLKTKSWYFLFVLIKWTFPNASFTGCFFKSKNIWAKSYFLFLQDVFNLSFDRMKIEQKWFPFAANILINGQRVAVLILIQIEMTAQNRDKHGISLVDLTAKNKQDKESIFNWIALVPKYALF